MSELERRLPADAALVDDQRPEALRGAVDRRREPGRPGADDDDVELAPFRIDRRADRSGELEIARSLERGPVREDHERKRAPSPEAVTSSLPCSESARTNACGMAQRPSTFRSS